MNLSRPSSSARRLGRPERDVWFRQWSLSRAGAIAVAVAKRSISGGPDAGPTGRRAAAQAVGSVLVAFGVALTVHTGLGAGPLDVFTFGFADATGVPVSVVMWSVAALLMLTATLLRNPPGAGTLVTPLLIGASIEPLLGALGRLPEAGLVVSIVVHMFAVAIMGVGAGAVVVAGFGAGTGELLADATSRRLDRSAAVVRLVMECSWLAVGVALGGPAGVGTVIVAGLIGPAVNRGVRLAAPLVNRRPAGAPAASRVNPDTPTGSPSRSLHRIAVPEATRAPVHR